MKVQSYDISMSSSFQKEKISSYNVEVRTWQNQQSENFVQLSISDEAKDLYKGKMVDSTNIKNDSEDIIYVKSEDELKAKILERLLSKLLGKRIKIMLPESTEDKIKSSDNLSNSSSAKQNIHPSSSGFGGRINISFTHQENEWFSFETKAVIKTTDGKSINLNLVVNYSKSVSERFDLEVRFGNQKNIDPIVINLKGQLPKLSSDTFEFDIDIDKNIDKIPFLDVETGFLAIDKNGDGKINDGSELFGPQSGDGFFELSTYDSDKNNWIDQNDPIFKNLKIWMKSEKGDYLFTLSDLNLGAIYLGFVNTKLDYTADNNNILASARKTGIAVKEDGTPLLVQHIDFKI